MARADFKSVDAYIAAQPETSHAVLEQMRGIIRKALPDAAEGISYQIPAYKLPTGTVIYFAGWKKHYSLYPMPKDVVGRLGSRLEPYKMSKGTIRFPLTEPVPVKLVEDIVALRAAEVAEEARAKAAAKAAKAR